MFKAEGTASTKAVRQERECRELVRLEDVSAGTMNKASSERSDGLAGPPNHGAFGFHSNTEGGHWRVLSWSWTMPFISGMLKQ